jgi:hypothetical protein
MVTAISIVRRERMFAGELGGSGDGGGNWRKGRTGMASGAAGGKPGLSARSAVGGIAFITRYPLTSRKRAM